MDTKDWVVTIDTSSSVNARIGKIKTFKECKLEIPLALDGGMNSLIKTKNNT